nr:(deoxy)nucleoside triphosphate pyrophosphohydrolase [uncultured Aminipila sp.]
MKELNVVAAILIYNNKILCAQRAEGKYEYISYKYEFPGGKLEAGESPEEALHRELIEEMDVNVDINKMKYFNTVNHEYPDFKIKMQSFICNVENANINLKEHVSIKWLEKNQLNTLDWAAADLPIVEKLMNI